MTLSVFLEFQIHKSKVPPAFEVFPPTEEPDHFRISLHVVLGLIKSLMFIRRSATGMLRLGFRFLFVGVV